MCPILALILPRTFWLRPLTVLTRPTRQTVCAINQFSCLDVYDLKQRLCSKIEIGRSCNKLQVSLHDSTGWARKWNSMFIFLHCTASPLHARHRHIRNIDCLMARSACLVCFISTVNCHSKKRKKRSLL